ncbi:uncharacterized protein LOC135074156 [Ostrinia nubilalis]|uniref:uncharacterized protein LOC114357262 n=1 Tax=Ostrinia furnacalis TaxID=93504 RepID=UPI0010408D7F|nr:uncharacterized protein LOC114357262 [Ostrinia furnacalis]
MKLQYVLYIAMFLSRQYICVLGKEGELGLAHMTDVVYTCSSYLSRIITRFCDNLITIVKRDTSSVLIDRLSPKSLLELRDKERVRKQERWRRVRRQIASECCDQPCNVGLIIKYCPEESKLFKERPDIFQD